MAEFKVSKVYKRGEEKEDGSQNWAFHFQIEGRQLEGREFGSKTGANRARALLINTAKDSGMTVYC